MQPSLFGSSGLPQGSASALYEAWAPPNSPWSPWVAPALFAQMECRDVAQTPDPATLAFDWFEARASRDTAVIIDLPGAESVRFALALARIGYRPVLLINSSPGPIGPMPPIAAGANLPQAQTSLQPSTSGIEVVDMRALVGEVCSGSKFMRELALPDDAPPTFVLDSTRLVGNRNVSEERFDNRWMVFPQDFPSASFLAACGIVRAVIVQRENLDPLDDLRHVLLRWQEAGIEIQASTAADRSQPRKIEVPRPSRFRAAWYRALAILGFWRSNVGGFGSFLPTGSGGGFGFGG